MACSDPSAASLGKCGVDCLDGPSTERGADAGTALDTGTAFDAATHPPGSLPQTRDAGELGAFERELAAVDEQMDYGYPEDPVLYELSRAAGHAGAALCICFEVETTVGFLAGCALDEGTNQLWPLPIDFAESMQCVGEQVGRAALEAYAKCATEVLQAQVQCYFERPASDQCIACVPDYEMCPESEAILGTAEVCSPFDGDPPPRTRRVKSEAAEP